MVSYHDMVSCHDKTGLPLECCGPRSSILVRWEAPAAQAGREDCVAYEVEAAPGGRDFAARGAVKQTTPGHARKCTVAGLLSDTEYQVLATLPPCVHKSER